MKEIGLFLQSVAPVVTEVRPGRPGDAVVLPPVKVYDDVNPDTGHALLLRRAQPVERDDG